MAYIQDTRIPLTSDQSGPEAVHPLFRNDSGQSYKVTLADEADQTFGDFDDWGNTTVPIVIMVAFTDSTTQLEVMTFSIDSVNEVIKMVTRPGAEETTASASYAGIPLNWADTDVDAKACFWVDTGGIPTFSNRTGATVEFTFKRVM